MTLWVGVMPLGTCATLPMADFVKMTEAMPSLSCGRVARGRPNYLRALSGSVQDQLLTDYYEQTRSRSDG